MNNDDLIQFRDQLAQWIDLRMEAGQLPFRRLEKDLSVVTRNGCLTADMVLWINRNSLIAGSLILLPKRVDPQILAQGSALAEALGLGHFVTWGAREVCLWQVTDAGQTALDTLPVPAADRIKPHDFRHLLEDLLNRLKMVTVTTSCPATQLSPLYYLNLCLCTLHDLLPDITDRVKLVAGEEQSDSWVAQKPVETAWLSLWRILFLVWQKRLPPGLLPERLEQAMQYALSELDQPPLSLLKSHDNEALLGNKVAVRLNHLAGRLKQLGWPRQSEHATALFKSLIAECADHLNMAIPAIPWPVPQPELLVNCWPGTIPESPVVVAPQPFLAGLALVRTTSSTVIPETLIDDVTRLPVLSGQTAILAQLNDELPPNKSDRQQRLVAMRQVWPNRRFDLHRRTPLDIWQALHLLGTQNPPGELTIILPSGWQEKPGAEVFWACAAERYQLRDSYEQDGRHVLHFGRQAEDQPVTRFHREETTLTIPYDVLRDQAAGLACIYQRARPEVIRLLQDNRLIPPGNQLADDPENLTGGAWQYLHSGLGRYLWSLACPRTPLPDREQARQACCLRGIPLPSRTILEAFEQLDMHMERRLSSLDKLDRQVDKLLGLKLEQPKSEVATEEPGPARQAPGKIATETIIADVFRDGVPHFPAHYLIPYYRPQLIHFDVPGPLAMADSFFDRILLTGPKQEEVEVSGKALADALLLAACNGPASVDLPAEETICEAITRAYRNDLQKHWEVLVRQCRSHVTERQAALKLARKIWRDLKLPPAELFEAQS